MEYDFDKYLYEISCKYNLDEDEIAANTQYIKDCYTKDVGIVAFGNAGYADNLFRKLDNIPSFMLKQELRFRNEHIWDDLSDVDTEDLEDELETRRDCHLVDKNKLDIEDLNSLAYKITGYRMYDDRSSQGIKDMICYALSINSWAYSKDELIELIKEKLKYIS